MRTFSTPYLHIVIFLFNFGGLLAQNFELKISTKDSLNTSIIYGVDFQKKHQNKQSLLAELDSLIFKFEKIGFLNSNLDSINNKDSVYTAYFNLGNSIKKIRIFYDEKSLPKKEAYKITKKVEDTFFEIDFSKTEKALNTIVNIFEQKGLSFTKAYLQNISLEENFIHANLILNISDSRKIDKVIVQGFEKFPKTYLKHFLNINKDEVFTRSKLSSISNKIKAIPFTTETKPPEILFTKDSTYLYLYLKKRKASQFDGLIGFTSEENSSNLIFNGYLDIELNNILNSGETISLNWKSNGNENQLFDLGVEIPFIFNSRISPSANLNIYRQDSTFINIKFNIGLNYLLNYRSSIGLEYSSESSDDLLDISLANVTDYTNNFYGLSYNYTIPNDDTIFTRKFGFEFTGYLGSRKSDGINTSQNKLGLSASYLWQLNFRNFIFLKSENQLINSDNLFTNELYRIGGVNSIRGFNEESIFSSLYSILNLEYRFKTNNSSYLYTISDFAYQENEIENLNNQLFSLGLGYSFRTGLGLINLSYAIGKVENQDFDLNNSRFHLKILNNF